MFDRLPTPFGLVRAGVAPDHPKIKSVIRVYEKTAAREGFRFFGNVEVGRDVTVAELERALQRGRLRLRHRDRPPARDPGRGPARLARGDRVRQLVQRPPRLRRPRLRPHRQARGRDRQRQRRRRRRPDARPAPGRARRHRHRRSRDRGARRVRGRGDRRARPPRAPRRRRSPTPRCASSASSPTPTSSSTRPRWSSTRRAASTSSPRTATRPTGATSRSSPTSPSAPPEGKPKRVVMRFCCSPVEIKGEGRVESIVVGRNELYRDESGAIRARDTGEREEIECGLVLRSIGYKGVGLEGIPFDAGRGLIPNDAGRVTDPESGEQVAGPLRGRLDQARPLRRDRDEQEGRPRHGQLDARGPRGGAHPRASERRRRPEAKLRTWRRSRSCSTSAAATTSPTSAGRRSTAAEVAAGEPHGRPRVKFCRVARDGRGLAPGRSPS